MVLSDCKILIKAINTENLNDLPHWSAQEVVAQCIQMFKLVQDRAHIQYISREKVIPAHCLANWARRMSGAFCGRPSREFMKEIQLQETLDQALFQLEPWRRLINLCQRGRGKTGIISSQRS